MDPIGRWASRHIVTVVAASIVIVLFVIGGIGLAASDGSSSPASSSTNSSSNDLATSTLTPQARKLKRFVTDLSNDAVSYNEPVAGGYIQDNLVTVGKMGSIFCADMTNGSTVATEAEEMLETLAQKTNLSSANAQALSGLVIGVAAKDLCPQFDSAVSAWGNSGSAIP
jgi:hypothetical protein